MKRRVIKGGARAFVADVVLRLAGQDTAADHAQDAHADIADAKKKRTEGAQKANAERRKKSAKHWALDWLEAAYREDPQRGADALAQRARALCAMNTDTPANGSGGARHHRDQITQHRARAFLRGKKSSA